MDASGSSFALELATAASFLLFAGGFWVVSALGQWALAPVDQRIALRCAARMRTRFSLAEFALLVVQVQLAASGCLLWIATKDDGGRAAACALAAGGIAAMWWVGLRRLAICQVKCRLRRAIFLGVVAPLACAAIIAGLWCNGRAVLAIVSAGDFATAPWLAGNAAALAAFLTCRQLTLWVLRGASGAQQEA